jgi:serine/threonine protein kinase
MRFERGGIRLDRSDDGVLDDRSNSMAYEGSTYVLRHLSEEFEGSKGGNSSVFVLRDPNGSQPDRAIKISNVYRPGRNTPDHFKRRYGRFIEEVDALRKCNEMGASNIVRLLWDGALSIKETLKNGTGVHREYPYYVMEKANTDLKEFLLSEPDTDIQTRVQLCFEVHQAIKQLHSAGYYHRDIKPDNVLLFGSTSTEEDGAGTLVWKIGDLGLVASRQKNYDELGEKVGPLGWLSPEAGNKFLTEKYDLGLDCVIDDRSDVFQLGKLIWFIFQHNIPIGIISKDDLSRDFPERDSLFDTVSRSLQHGKARRYDMDNLETDLKQLAAKYHA